MILKINISKDPGHMAFYKMQHCLQIEIWKKCAPNFTLNKKRNPLNTIWHAYGRNCPDIKGERRQQ